MDHSEVVPGGTVSDRIYTALRARIVGGALMPGLILREGELAETVGVGRTPARLALKESTRPTPSTMV